MLRLLTCALLATAATAQVTYYSAYLDNTQEVPATVSPGHGWGIVRFDAGTNQVSLYVHHLPLSSGLLAAHLHIGAFGVNGGVLVGMSPIATNTWGGTGTLSAGDAASLVAGNTYLNVHTSTNPGGEIRGQVVLGKSTRFTGVLSGANEVPANASTGSGTAVAFLHEPDNRLVYMVQSAGLTNVTAAHFHQAPAGVNGPVIVGFTGSGSYCGVSQRLTPSQVTALMANGWYANVHTSTFPGGEIRAQMIRDVGDHFYAVCDGAQETPPVPSNGVGGASLVLAPNGVATVSGQFAGLTSNAIAAHVHIGAPGVAGGVVFGLSFAGGQLSGTFTPSPADLVNLRAGNWYVNIHSVNFGGGEIRGQLLAATLPAGFGEGCTSSTGTIPRAGANGIPTIGAPITFEEYGVPAGAPALMFVAFNRDTGPIDLALLGYVSPECYALIDPLSIIDQYLVFADGLGCVHVPLVAPLNPLIRGLSFGIQFANLDAPANPSGVIVSNALWFKLP